VRRDVLQMLITRRIFLLFDGLAVRGESTVFSFIRDPKDFWSGVMFLVFGLSAVLIGQDYEMGSAGRMGPGYFPVVLGGMLSLIGLVSVVRSFFHQGEGLGRFALKEAFLVLFAVLLF